MTGADDLMVWHDQIQYKPPGYGGVTSWHQDAPLWPIIRPMTPVSAWIALDDAEEENGCMWMVPGSHRCRTSRSSAGTGNRSPRRQSRTYTDDRNRRVHKGDAEYAGGIINPIIPDTLRVLREKCAPCASLRFAFPKTRQRSNSWM